MYLLKDGKGLGLEVQRHARPLGREARPFYGLRRLVVRSLPLGLVRLPSAFLNPAASCLWHRHTRFRKLRVVGERIDRFSQGGQPKGAARRAH